MRLRLGMIVGIVLAAAMGAQSTPFANIQTGSPFLTMGPSAATDNAIVVTVNGVLSRSLDRGRTWQTVPLALNAEQLVADGHSIYAIGGRAAAYVSQTFSSFDDGATWQGSAPLPLAVQGAQTRTLAAAGQQLHMVLADDPSGSLRYLRSTDGGRTWPASSLVTLGTIAPGYGAYVAVAGNVVHVAWRSSTASVNYAQSVDGGNTWSAARTLSPNSGVSDLTVAGSHVWVATDVGVQHSTDGGATWSAVVTGLNFGSGTRVAAEGLTVCIAMGGTAAAYPFNEEVRIAASTDAGLTWTLTVQPLHSTGFPIFAATADLFVHGVHMGVVVGGEITFGGGGYVGVTWALLHSSNSGLTWQDSLFNSNFWWVRRQRFAVQGDTCSLLFDHNPNLGSLSVAHAYASLLYGYQPYGTAKPGTGNLAPNLDGSGAPLLGNATTLAMTQALGGTVAAIGATFAGAANIPLGAGTLLLQPPTIAVVSVTSGASGTAGVGTTSLTLPIPANPALHAARVNFQGFALDPAAADGFAATAGVEMWVF